MTSASAGAGGEEPAAGPVPATPVAAPAPVRSRWSSEIKVYYRRYPRKKPKPPPPPEPSPNLSPLSETLPSIRHSVRNPDDGVTAGTGPTASTSSPPPLVPAAAAPPSPPASPPAAAAPISPTPPSPIQAARISPPPRASAPATATSSSHLAPDPAPPGQPTPAFAPPEEPTPDSNDISSGPVPNGHGNDQALVTAEKARKRRARSELRRQLASELDQVRVLSKRLKVVAEALTLEASATMHSAMLHVSDAGYTRSQFSPTGPITPTPAQAAGVAPVGSQRQRGPLTVSVVHTEPFKKEKRTPRANPLYRSSEFLLARDKFPPTESQPQGRTKSKHHKKKHRHGQEFDAERRLYSHAFKKSSALLSRLMKHRFAWVFNKPVDAVALGLHDYFLIIKHPMDLGTIRARLSHGQYRNPKEFAADVRLTFHNAMTYNPKGQDAHVMAEQLLGIFEAQWQEIEAEVDYLASCPPLPKEFPPPPIDLRYLERSGSVKHNMALDSNSRLISHTPNYSARTPSSRKPRAKDPNKRDMTIEEKRKLSENLQNLPLEKLNAVVQIIKNKNLSVRQHEDEIEVEIDSMDPETLWELDRFVANYKKYLSKQKRKAERAMLARQNAELRAQYTVQQPQTTQEANIGEKSPTQNFMVAEQLVSSIPNQNGTSGQNASSSGNSSSSSSDSGSSSSDSDSDSSSSDGSGAANPS